MFKKILFSILLFAGINLVAGDVTKITSGYIDGYKAVLQFDKHPNIGENNFKVSIYDESQKISVNDLEVRIVMPNKKAVVLNNINDKNAVYFYEKGTYEYSITFKKYLVGMSCTLRGSFKII